MARDARRSQSGHRASNQGARSPQSTHVRRPSVSDLERKRHANGSGRASARLGGGSTNTAKRPVPREKERAEASRRRTGASKRKAPSAPRKESRTRPSAASAQKRPLGTNGKPAHRSSSSSMRTDRTNSRSSSTRVRPSSQRSAAPEKAGTKRPSRSVRAKSASKGAALSSRHKQQADQLLAESGIPADILKDPTRPKNAAGTQESKKRSGLNVLTHAGGRLMRKSKLLSAVLIIFVVLCLVGGIDALTTMNRIYQGVNVGDIDLSGKTVEEATSLISQEYEPRFSHNAIVFCATEELAQKTQGQDEGSDSLEEQISYEESLASRDRWTVDAQHLGATFDPALYAMKAYQVGREDGGLFGRLQAMFSGRTIDPVCSFNQTSLDEFRDEIIAVLGTKMVNFNVKMEDAQAKVTEGNDGYEVSQEWLVDKLNEGFLRTDGESRFVVEMHDVPVQIDQEGAQKCAEQIDASIACGITFQYEGKEWYADRTQLADWIATEVTGEGSSFMLKPFFAASHANQAIVKGFGFAYDGSDYTVQFEKTDGAITVRTNATGTVPQLSEALNSLNSTFFTSNTKTQAPVVAIQSTDIPETMSFEEACDYGLVTEISSFTTQYASGAEARNNNIHVAADALTDSICKAGQTWSFLELSGEATPEKGYQGAGAIIGGEYSDAIGGGICQVATTVFNAVYDSGYPVERRYNHSLYIASYPEGRDAAIAYPDMDLVWRNDTESDVLLVMSYTNSSVTAKLYGVDPGYVVTTSYGEWQKGEPYKTIIHQDPDYPVGKEFIETQGTDGRSITIVRTVKGEEGNTIHEDEFHSNYKPKNKIVVQGSAQSTTKE